MMAVMWPRRLPDWVMHDPRRKAEREVYGRLDLVLDDSWSVYYSRPWWGITKTGAEVDGEADFVLAHPDHGVLFLEVKGGLVEHDPETTSWTSKDRDGVRHRIKDPVQQAMSAKHRLLAKMRREQGWPGHRVRLRHGVVLPDCVSVNAETVAGYEKELFCMSTQFRDRFATWIHKRLASHVSEGRDVESGPGASGIAAIDAAIAAPARLTVPLHRQVSVDIAQQDQLLSGAQLMAIMSIDAFPRAVVEGGAGTGKTLIACELAIRYARSGKATLLCCLSDALAASLKDRIGSQPGLTVMTLDEAASAVACARLSKQDAVLVDEGQDVDWLQWDLVEDLIKSGGMLRVMFDSNQAVYRARDDLETRLGATGFPLRLNLRNTQRVAEVTERLYRGPLISCAGPEGEPAVLVETTQAEMTDAALRCVQELVWQHDFFPSDIALLVPDAKVGDFLRSKLSAASLKATDAVTRSVGAVVIETIARFKGLEAAAVVVISDRLAANNNELSYVATSRARALLFVVGPIHGTILGNAVASSSST